jgi:hypothetical protein
MVTVLMSSPSGFSAAGPEATPHADVESLYRCALQVD